MNAKSGKAWLNRHRSRILLAAVLLTGLAAYLMNLTHSALWYDEAIEYFYSAILTGPVPGGRQTASMYERICSTYQPPLYNVLMYVWLLLTGGSESAFRLAGVLVTLAGAAGIYLCIRTLTEEPYALGGTLLYLFTSTVAYYALECAEYNLMLCCLAWTLFFFVRYLQRPGGHFLAGFFLTACLSVYSQYGAVFPVMALYLLLLAAEVKNGKHLRRLFLCTAVTAIAAVLPLMIFFLLPQMAKQGTTDVSHFPVFRVNPVYDYFRGALTVVAYVFRTGGAAGPIGLLPLAIAAAALLCSAAAIRKGDRPYLTMIGVCVLSYSLYFAAVACSFYGYDGTNNRPGCYNLGERYCLFFAPLFVVTLTVGVSRFIARIRSAGIRRLLPALTGAAAILFCFAGFYSLATGWEKDDVRGAAQTWYDCRAYEDVTFVHEWSDANFQFYLRQDDRYEDSFQEHIVTAEEWIRRADHDEMEEKLLASGILALDKIYYIGPYEAYPESYEIFLQVMEEHGYSVSELFKNHSALLRLEKTQTGR